MPKLIEPPEGLLEFSEAARRLGVSSREILDLIDRREVPAVHDRKRGRLYVPAGAVPAPEGA
jgi:excisionase family DNA binding protein